MAGLGSVPWWAGVLYVAAFAAFALRTYPRALARIRRPSLWIEMAAVMLLAGLVFGGVRNGLAGLLDGVAAGRRDGPPRDARALRVHRDFGGTPQPGDPLAPVERHRLVGLSDALGVAFGALPAFTSALTGGRRLWRRPSLLAANMLQIANRLVRWPDRPPHGPAFGHRHRRHRVGQDHPHHGRRRAPARARHPRRGHPRTGATSPTGDAPDSTSSILRPANESRSRAKRARRRPAPAMEPVRVFARGLALGHKALGEDRRGADVVVVDEVGPFELSGGGWADALDALVATSSGAMLLVVREAVVDAVKARWGSAGSVVYDVASADPPGDRESARSPGLSARARGRSPGAFVHEPWALSPGPFPCATLSSPCARCSSAR